MAVDDLFAESLKTGRKIIDSIDTCSRIIQLVESEIQGFNINLFSLGKNIDGLCRRALGKRNPPQVLFLSVASPTLDEIYVEQRY
jgi:hypothetical protein